ncbi:flagellar assembly peptidoglycan hydrolase FlgJ [Ferrimonas marina]|uniref:Peptidoglycan hydrolase FlgJ n=1 Tax=Ferrimonas marina TaxID=299255 RepID=A0A1M5YCB1_9GAMM|nr:flagellar assembly peptidoglycan hydrolase FlgJ [Ferrimonas marina]SHI09163.1 flagellar protein FlgJ [Ferrimonas marina]
MDSLKQNHYLDMAGLDQMRQQAQADPDASLRQVALQFEGIFLNMMLKSMRDANAAFEDTDSPFASQTTQFYRQMHDSQMATELASQGSLGLADLIVDQWGGNEQLMPASALRSDSLTPNVVAASAQAPEPVTQQTPEQAGITPVHPPLQAAMNPEPQPIAPLRNIAFEGPEHFVQTLLPQAEQAAAELGQDPMLLIAQAALETGWGRKILTAPDGNSSHNLFNIKADRRWDGDHTMVNALEFEDQLPVMQRSAFRIYDDLKASFDDYVDFLRQPRYADALQATDASGFIHGLQQAGYATDPNYANKILNVFQNLLKQAGTR